LLKVTHRNFFKLHNYPQKDVLVLMLPTQKRFASKVPAENRNCLSLPTKAGFFEKVPTDERKRLGATNVFVLFLTLFIFKALNCMYAFFFLI